MKIAEYNDMMAHLTRRQQFSNGGAPILPNGGTPILPKPHPLSQEERNQRVFDDYVGRMKKYLTGAEMPEWFVKDLIIKKAEELGIELKADGGRVRYANGSNSPGELTDLLVRLRNVVEGNGMYSSFSSKNRKHLQLALTGRINALLGN